MTGPDWSHIDSNDAAVAAAGRGDLVKLLLLPAMFGGSDVPANVVYVPPFVRDEKARIDANVIGPMAREGSISRYAATPRYQGKSFVPSAIVITASDPKTFEALIKIWGDALG